MIRTSVQPDGRFLVGLHRPAFTVANLRRDSFVMELGHLEDGTGVDNRNNFPDQDIEERAGRWIYEIANPLPFRGTTYIDSGWADARAGDPAAIGMEPAPQCSLLQLLTDRLQDSGQAESILADLPKPLLYDLAANSTDPDELVLLARSCCRLEFDRQGRPTGLCYRKQGEQFQAVIDDFELFETIANNPYLPDRYKEVMVLRPGVQGGSEIVGDWQHGDTRIFEYLRRNSYIPWGHYAANMAHTSVRYHTRDLDRTDMEGLRHLYYQRIYVNLAGQLGIEVGTRRRRLSTEELETLRLRILERLQETDLQAATLWGWNFGYDFSGSGYRLHASHQMIHQQYALVGSEVPTTGGDSVRPFSSGDMVAEVVAAYAAEYGSDFFSDYLKAIRNNQRTDGRDGEADLAVWRDDHVLLFVPKAQVSQWELQLMVTADRDGEPVGNVVEADVRVRRSIDRGILLAQHVLARLGVQMVSTIEYSKRLGLANGQRLLYSFLPKLPWSMGAFSEAQLRFICGHYPEDFATACRARIGGQDE